MRIHIAPIPAPFLQQARVEGVDALGQPVKRIVSATGGEPCRDVLRRARPGEQLILASFSPFAAIGPYREFGPVFILADAADEDVPRETLPTDRGYLRERFVIRAYSAAEEIVDAVMVGPEDADEAIARFFDRSDVAFLHARFPVYGCFACRIDRQ